MVFLEFVVIIENMFRKLLFDLHHLKILREDIFIQNVQREEGGSACACVHACAFR